MKNKNFKKLLASVLTVACMTGLLAGCGNSGNASQTSQAESKTSSQATSTGTAESVEEVEETVGITYPLEGNHTLTMAVMAKPTVTAYYDSWAASPFVQAWQEQTGITLEITEYTDPQPMALMMASGELPDIMIYNFNWYSGGAAKAIDDKIIEPMNNYIEYAPDMMAALELEENFINDVTTEKGDIIGFPFIRGDEYLCVISGMIIRQDWLDEIGMDIPQTPDELYQVLKAFKEELNVEYPLSTSYSQLLQVLLQSGSITSPFGLVKGDWYVKDDEMHYGFAEKEYKDVLEYLHKLYEEGLLDPNFATLNSTTSRSNFMNGLSGVTSDSGGGGLGAFVNGMPDAKLAGVGSLVAKEGDTPMSGHFEAQVQNVYGVITPQCENKEIAAQFLNYLYTEEGHLLANFGNDGESYTMVDGVPTYTDLVMNNPDGMDRSTALSHYCLAWDSGPMVQDKGYGEQYFNLPEQIQAKTLWSQTDAKKYFAPSLSIAEEDTAEYNKLNSDITTYVNEMMIHYIDGTKDLADFETEYLGTLKEMGIDKLIAIKQAAYDRYIAK